MAEGLRMLVRFSIEPIDTSWKNFLIMTYKNLRLTVIVVREFVYIILIEFGRGIKA